MIYSSTFLCDQKYKWHTFAVFFLIFAASVDPLSKNKSRIILQKCWNFCKQLTLPGQTATSKTCRNFGIVIDRFIWTIELCHIWNLFKHFFIRTLFLATTNAMIYSSTFYLIPRLGISLSKKQNNSHRFLAKIVTH
jgi:hypothetical protein